MSLKRGLLFISGWLSFLLGVVGVVLPVLPTTPFMILAATCFAKSSPRFHRWLLSSRIFGPMIKNWQEERYIESRAKRRALVFIALTFGLSIYLVDFVWLKGMLICFWCICSGIVGRLPTVPLSNRRS